MRLGMRNATRKASTTGPTPRKYPSSFSRASPERRDSRIPAATSAEFREEAAGGEVSPAMEPSVVRRCATGQRRTA